MQPSEFQWALFLLRRRAEEGENELFDIVRDGEALLEGKPTNAPRERVVADVVRKVTGRSG